MVASRLVVSPWEDLGISQVEVFFYVVFVHILQSGMISEFPPATWPRIRRAQ